MTLILTLVALAVGFTGLLWGVSLILQGYLYSQPADRLGVRAAVGAFVMATFLTCWTYANTRAGHKDKYGTFFEFAPAALQDVPEFEAVHESFIKDATGKPKQSVVKFKWEPPGEFRDKNHKKFVLNTSDYVTTAMVVPGEGGKTVKFVADRDAKGTYVRRPNEPLAFREEGGGRVISEDDFHKMTVPSRSAYAAALALNAVHFGLWFVVFWPVLRFGTGAALGLTAVCGATTMIVLMPLLFEKNAKPTPPGTAATPAAVG